MFGKHKGQFFLLIALMLAIYFSVLFTYSSPYETLLKSRKSLDYFTYKESLKNVEEEQKKIFVYFYFNQSLKDFLKNFTLYAREKLEFKNVELKTILLLASYDEIKANQEETLEVSLLNLVGREISNINITFTYNNTSKTLAYLPDSSFFETSFGFNISSDSNYKLILQYFDGENQKYEIEIPLKIGKSKKIGFFVNSLKAGEFLLKKDFVEVK